jgi:DNA-binding SARP family transcriptional activator
VVVDDEEVPLSRWGSRRARQLCKRLVAAGGQPVAREQLIDLLWPDAVGLDRLGARLSVQLSTVRRVLGRGVIADRDSVRIDVGEVRIDVVDLHAAAKAGDLQQVTDLYRGEFLPLDIYEDWAAAERERARSAFVRAAHGLALASSAAGDHDRAAAFARRILAADQFDEDAHCRLITALAAAGHEVAARQAHVSYTRRMDELGRPFVPLAEMGIAAR